MKNDLDKKRHELKYIYAESDLQIIENKIKSVCRRDRNSNEKGQYRIRSVYFDTYNDAFLKENEAGVDNRKKYRIRIYNNSADYIQLECKETVADTKSKKSCRVTKDQCEKLIAGEKISDFAPDQTLLTQFLTESKINIYEPKVIVEYDRNAYIHPVGNTRITFDRNICASMDFEHFFEKRIYRRAIMPQGKNILEVKYDEVIPDFIWGMIPCRSSSQRSSFSKYSLCRTHNI